MQFIEEENLYRFTIIGPETDIHDRLHYHSLFAMLQEAACLDADRHGFGSDKMDELTACWLILRMKVVMKLLEPTGVRVSRFSFSEIYSSAR